MSLRSFIFFTFVFILHVNMAATLGGIFLKICDMHVVTINDKVFIPFAIINLFIYVIFLPMYMIESKK